MRLILDCDPGNDDALAILAACGALPSGLAAVTTGMGHLAADRTARNAAIALAMAGRGDVPVAQGSAAPLVRERLVARILDGEGALDPERPDLPAVPLAAEGSVALMARMLREGPATIVTTGPLTNLALLLRAAPEAAASIARVVALGGAWGLGNRTAAAEWNMLCDPEAAAIVLGAGLDVILVPIDAAAGAGITDTLVTRIEAIGTAPAQFAAELLLSLRRTFRPGLFSPPEMPLNDPVALLLALDPTLAELRPARVEVELAGRHCYGRTVIDFAGRSGLPDNAHVAVRLEEGRIHDALVAALAALPDTP